MIEIALILPHLYGFPAFGGNKEYIIASFLRQNLKWSQS
jgi:hypothetical protein